MNSAQESTQYRECETSAPSVDLSSQQSDLHQMLLDMSRRMDDMQEKFDKRLQSLESQVSELSQNVNSFPFIFNVIPCRMVLILSSFSYRKRMPLILFHVVSICSGEKLAPLSSPLLVQTLGQALPVLVVFA